MAHLEDLKSGEYFPSSTDHVILCRPKGDQIAKIRIRYVTAQAHFYSLQFGIDWVRVTARPICK